MVANFELHDIKFYLGKRLSRYKKAVTYQRSPLETSNWSPVDIPTSRSVVLDRGTGREYRPLFELGLPTPKAWAAVRRPREQPGTVGGSDSQGSLVTERDIPKSKMDDIRKRI